MTLSEALVKGYFDYGCDHTCSHDALTLLMLVSIPHVISAHALDRANTAQRLQPNQTPTCSELTFRVEDDRGPPVSGHVVWERLLSEFQLRGHLCQWNDVQQLAKMVVLLERALMGDRQCEQQIGTEDQMVLVLTS